MSTEDASQRLLVTNSQLAEIFEEMADLLELSGENAFRVRAYRSGSAAIAGLTQPVTELLGSGFDLTKIDGIGETLAEKSKVVVQTGRLPQLETLRLSVPPSLRDVMKVPGLGAKKAMKLYQELGVIDLSSLKAACVSGSVEGLKGFGKKTQENILQNLEIVMQAAMRLRLDQAEELVERLRFHFQDCPSLEKIEFAGSFRRRKETVGDLDILVVSSDPSDVMDRFALFPGIQGQIVRGDTKMSVRLANAFQVDLRVVEGGCWGAALQYFTGSKEHNVHIRSIAKAKGLKISEYGVFLESDDTRAIAGEDEQSLYAAVGLPWVPPLLRENRFEFQPDFSQRLAGLVQVEDIRGDLHMHTTYTDGEATIEQMVQCAFERGLQYIALTDHSKRVSVARGMDDDQVLKQWKEIDRIAKDWEGKIAVFKGIECDILEDGAMDLKDSTLAQADWVTASIHFGLKQSRQEITDRILYAIRHPHVHSISHPTGRLLSRRQAYEADWTAIMQASVEYGKCLEINSNPERLDLSDLLAAAAAEHGVSLVINTDAHATSQFGLMRYGVQVAQRAGLTKENILNTRTLEAFKCWLSDRSRFPVRGG
jgi:DNA polymerase (family 10)